MSDASGGATQGANGKKGEPAAVASRSGGKVTVACKIPNGLILRIFRFEEFRRPVLGGGERSVKEAIELPGRVLIRGPAIPVNRTSGNPLIVGGYALTPNVDADFWRTWLEQNADHEAVRNNLIFAHEKADTVQGMADDRDEVRSGLEPMEQKGDPRAPKAIPGVSAIEPATKSEAA